MSLSIFLGLEFVKASREDVPELTSLVNRAYRGESSRLGWTTEADLLGGLRIDESWMRMILSDPDSLLLLAKKGTKIVASIHANREDHCVHFGLFAVEPLMQGEGIGKALLAFAEKEVIKRWKVTEGRMEVITRRSELIDFYERHGYKRTGDIVPFPHSDLWSPTVPHLEMAVLRKCFT